MSNEIVDKINKNKLILSQIKYSLDSKKKEMSELLKDENVRKYIVLSDRIHDLEEEQKQIIDKNNHLKRDICTHRLVFFIEEESHYKTSISRYYCMDCNKVVEGELGDNHICINEKSKSNDVFSSLKQYRYIKEIYESINDEEMSEEEIVSFLRSQLNNIPKKVLKKEQ